MTQRNSPDTGALRLPMLPLRDVVVYPHQVVPLFVGREKSILALDAVMSLHKQIVLIAQKDAAIDEPVATDLYQTGTLATVLQMLKLPDGTVKVLVEGNHRVRIDRVDQSEDFPSAEYQAVESVANEPSAAELSALQRTLNVQFEQYVSAGKKVPAEVVTMVAGIEEADRLVDAIATHMSLSLEQKQEVLEIFDVRERMDHVLRLIEAELEALKLEQRIRGRVKKQMEKSQREYYLNEQMKAIQKELGEGEDGPNEIQQLEKRIGESGMPKAALEKVNTELGKLKMMSPMSAEASVLRSYIDWMVSVPWRQRSKIKHDLARAERILNEDHYGLEEVKERIIEFLAVQKRVKKLKGPVLCLVGPPGVGKTSLGESIARATGRKFARMSLGGVRDEAEIRGHRRTYIGSMPGKIVNNLRKAGTSNPLFLLDEIDKLGQDFRGDPASALLEVLDPEQNSKFQDHYLELDLDLSDVMFVTTANSLNLPQPLLDRMEIIRLEGYTEDEKVEIAKRHLIAKQIEAHGLKAGEFELTDEGLRDLIRYYTREAGVRTLEREIARLARKSLRRILEKKATSITVTPENLGEFAGVRKFRHGMSEDEAQIGAVTGLAWTEVGGELLTIESVTTPGKGEIKTTGKLGEVMTESVAAAFSFVKARAPAYGIKPSIFQRKNIHIHLPEGAVPKDGPSAGVGMVTSIISTLSGVPVRPDVAMTGEVTLRGRVLAIGGLKEKLLAALRGGITTVLIPEENVKDLAEIPANVKEGLKIIPVSHVDQVLEHALVSVPAAIEWTEADDLASQPVVHPGGAPAPTAH